MEYSGHFYRLQKEVSNTSYFTCCNWRCKGKLRRYISGNFVTSGVHTCDVQEIEQKLKTKEMVKSAAQNIVKTRTTLKNRQ